MALFHWFSKAEEGEKLQPDDESDGLTQDDDGTGRVEEEPSPSLCASEPVDGCWSCAQRGGVCPFHAEIPRLS